ncbi:MAG: hypothetical protein Q8K00_08390 [Syntrophales bacterium]|nr:hypothetical protein [Syntrophales bacterium]
MKKINLRVEFDMELEVPDHVKPVKVSEDMGELLFIHGRLLEPELGWRALSKITDDGELVSEIVSDELFQEIQDMIKITNKADMRISALDGGNGDQKEGRRRR